MNELTIYKSKEDFTQLMLIANTMATSGRFQGDTTPAQAAVKIMAGLELGLSPIFAMSNIILVNGRVTLGASVVAALIKKSGKYDYDVVELTDNLCHLEFKVDGKRVGPSIFTMDDARLAGLTGKDVWKKFPRNMLFSRALTNGARWYAAEVFSGPIYTPEELQDGGYDESVIVDITPKNLDTDDLAHLSVDEFYNRIREEINSELTNEEIIATLKANNKSWLIDSKREMFELVRKLKALPETSTQPQT